MTRTRDNVAENAMRLELRPLSATKYTNACAHVGCRRSFSDRVYESRVETQTESATSTPTVHSRPTLPVLPVALAYIRGRVTREPARAKISGTRHKLDGWDLNRF